MAKILFVEDDRGLAEMVLEWLACERHSIEHLTDGQTGLDYLQYGKYDIAILDWTLPGKTGLDICKEHRSKGGKTPVLMLTAKGTENDKELGLDSGADDYLTKPFSVKELSARIRALLRRPPNTLSNIIAVKDLKLDSVKHCLTRNGNEIQLLPKEFSLLEFFMRHPDEIFSSEALLDRIWHSDSEVTPDAVRTCLKRLRRKIDGELNESISYIQTVPKLGYKMSKS
jgi:DNA-binding response OmpR family regulator